MVRSIQTNDEWYALESQVRECYGRVAYSHKTHEKMADRKSALQAHIKLGQIGLSALTASGAVGAIILDQAWVSGVTALLSFATLALSSYAKDINPGALAVLHRQTASDLWSVREQYLSLLTDIRDDSVDGETLRRRRDELLLTLHAVYKAAPHTDGEAYGAAQDALKNKEDLTFSERELDLLLPVSLRRLQDPPAR